MEILRLTEAGQVQGSALGRKLRVKVMQHIGLLEIGPSRGEEIEVSETLEGVIDFLLSSISDKVIPLPECGVDVGYHCTVYDVKISLEDRAVITLLFCR